MWPGGKVGDQFAPPDRPPCGFLNELCKAEKGSEVLWRSRFQFRFAFVDLFVNALFGNSHVTPIQKYMYPNIVRTDKTVY